jgi:hypothetical protein
VTLGRLKVSRRQFHGCVSYLYRHLRGTGGVQGLAQRHAEDIGAELGQLLSSDRLSSDRVAEAYAALVALTLRDYKEWRTVVGSLDLSKLHWGDHVRGIATAKAHTGTTLIENATNVIVRPAPASTAVTSFTASRPRAVMEQS